MTRGMLFAAVAMVAMGCSTVQSPPVAMETPGLIGPRGPDGSSGAAGSIGATGRWTSFREFMFGYERSDMQPSDWSSISEIAAYMKQNPALQLGIDGSIDPRGNDPRDENLSNRRVGAVRDALMRAGVPSDKIQTGAFGDTRLTRDRRVEVLISPRR